MTSYLSNLPMSCSSEMVEAFHGEGPECPVCHGSELLCDDCGQTIDVCACKPYVLDGETFYREIRKCGCQR